jgi:hypothetical protein
LLASPEYVIRKISARLLPEIGNTPATVFHKRLPVDPVKGKSLDASAPMPTGLPSSNKENVTPNEAYWLDTRLSSAIGPVGDALKSIIVAAWDAPAKSKVVAAAIVTAAILITVIVFDSL